MMDLSVINITSSNSSFYLCETTPYIAVYLALIVPLQLFFFGLIFLLIFLQTRAIKGGRTREPKPSNFLWVQDLHSKVLLARTSCGADPAAAVEPVGESDDDDDDDVCDIDVVIDRVKSLNEMYESFPEEYMDDRKVSTETLTQHEPQHIDLSLIHI